MSSPSRPFPIGNLGKAARDGDRPKVERLLALCTFEEHVDDKIYRLTAFEICIWCPVDIVVECVSLIWSKYREIGSDLKEVLDRIPDSMKSFCLFPLNVARRLGSPRILSCYREAFGEEASTKIREVFERVKGLSHKDVEDEINKIFPSESNEDRWSCSNYQDDENTQATKRPRASNGTESGTTQVQSSKKARQGELSSTSTAAGQDADSSVDERKPAAREVVGERQAATTSPAGLDALLDERTSVARKVVGERRQASATTSPLEPDAPPSSAAASSSGRSSTNASAQNHPRPSLGSRLSKLEYQLEIVDQTGTFMSRLRRVRRTIWGEKAQERLSAALSLDEQVDELVSYLL
jgi:hypothetical protein